MFDTIITATRLESFLEPQLALVQEARWHLDEEGIQVKAVDPANVGMIDITLAASACESYEADGDLIALNLGQFEDVLSVIDSADLVHLSINEQTRKLEIEAGTFEYTQALIAPNSVRDDPDLPDLDLPAEIVVGGSELDRGVTAADLVDDHITLAADPDQRSFIMEAEGDTDDTRIELGRDELIDARVPEAVSSIYSLDYLKDITGPIEAETEVTVRLGAEFPVKWFYEGEDGHPEVEYMIAPRIQSD